jgi:hypothetical protein
LISQFHYHAQLNDSNEIDVDKEAQQQTLRAIFSLIRESVKELPGKQYRGYTY